MRYYIVCRYTQNTHRMTSILNLEFRRIFNLMLIPRWEEVTMSIEN